MEDGLMKNNKIMQQFEENNSWGTSDEMQTQANKVINEVFSLAHDIRMAWEKATAQNDLTILIKLNDRLMAVQFKLDQNPSLHETVTSALNKQVQLDSSITKIKAQHRVFSLGLIVDHMLFNSYNNLFAEINKQINSLAQLIVKQNSDNIKLNHIHTLSEDLSPLILQMQQILNNIPKKLLPIDFIKQLKNVESGAVNPQTVQESLKDMKDKLEQAKTIIPTLKSQYHLFAEAKRQQSNQYIPINNSQVFTVNGSVQREKGTTNIQPLSQQVVTHNNLNRSLKLTDENFTTSSDQPQRKTGNFSMGDKTGFAKRIKDIRKEINEMLKQRDDILLSLEQEIGQKNYSNALNELKLKYQHHLIAIEAAIHVMSKEWTQFKQENSVAKDNIKYIDNLFKSIREQDIEKAKQLFNTNQSREQFRTESKTQYKVIPINPKSPH